MLPCEVRLRVVNVASRFMDCVRDDVITDFDDDIRLLDKGVLTPDDIVNKWAAYIGLNKKEVDK